jgi:hypothetical protein
MGVSMGPSELKTLASLTKPARDVLAIMADVMAESPQGDYVILTPFCGDSPSRRFRKGLRELIDKGVISATPSHDIYKVKPGFNLTR